MFKRAITPKAERGMAEAILFVMALILAGITLIGWLGYLLIEWLLNNLTLVR